MNELTEKMTKVTSISGYDPSNPLHSSWSRIFSRQRYEARRRGLSFNVSAEDAWKILNDQNWQCALSGVKFTPGGGAAKTQMSLDRKDNKIGYEPGNIQYVTLFINRVKNYLSDEEFIAMCKQVAGHAK